MQKKGNLVAKWQLRTILPFFSEWHSLQLASLTKYIYEEEGLMEYKTVSMTRLVTSGFLSFLYSNVWIGICIRNSLEEVKKMFSPTSNASI